jgi:hypothetical protein
MQPTKIRLLLATLAPSNGGSTLNISGSVNDINATLQTLQYQLQGNYAGVDTVLLSTQDGSYDIVSTIGLSTVAAYSAPGISISGGLTVSAGSLLDFSSAQGTGITVSAPPNTVVTTTVSVAEADASLTATAEGSATVQNSYSDGNSIITIQGKAADTNAVLNTLVAQASPNFAGPATLTVNTSDGVSTVEGTEQITSGTEHAPGQRLPAGQALNASGSITFSANNAIVVSDVDGNALTTVVNATNGSLSAQAQDSAVLAFSNGGETLTVSGTVAAINATLQGLRYQAAANSDAGDALTVTTTTSDGNYSTSGQIVLTAPETSPVITVPGGQVLNSSNSITFGSAQANTISLSDAQNVVLTVFVGVSNGTLSVSAPTPAGVTVQSLANDKQLSITGLPSGINQVLNGLQYHAQPGYFGYDELQIGAGIQNGAVFAVGTVGLSPSTADLAPDISVPTGQLLNTNGNLSFSPANGNPIGVSASTGVTLQTTITVQHGTLAATAAGGTTVSGSGTSLTIQGTASGVNATLNSLTYQEATGYQGNDLLSISVSDGTYESSNQVGISAAAADPGPGCTVPGGQTIGANGAVSFSTANGNALGVSDAAGDNLSVQLEVANGSLNAQPQGSANVTNSPSGLVISGSVQDINAVLNTLVYTDNPGYHGNDQIKVLASDGTLDASASVNLVAMNAGPGVTLPPSQLVGNQGQLSFNSAIGNALTVSSPGGYGLTTTVSVLHGTVYAAAQGAANLSINGSTLTITGSVSDTNATLSTLGYQENSGYQGPDTLSISTTDGFNSSSGSIALASSSLNGVINALDVREGVAISGTVSQAGQVTVQIFDANDNPAAGQSYTATTINGTWSVQPNFAPLPDGTYTVAATETVSGNISAPQLQTIIQHQTLPTVSINTVDGGSVGAIDAVSGLPVTGAVSGLAAGAQFTINVSDGARS